MGRGLDLLSYGSVMEATGCLLARLWEWWLPVLLCGYRESGPTAGFSLEDLEGLPGVGGWSSWQLNALLLWMFCFPQLVYCHVCNRTLGTKRFPRFVCY